MRIKCESHFLNQNNLINQKSNSALKTDKLENVNSFPVSFSSTKHTSQLCDKNGNNLLMIAPVIGIHGITNRSGHSFQAGLPQNQYNAFGDWIRGNKSSNFSKSNRSTNSQLHPSPVKSAITLVGSLTNENISSAGNCVKKRLKMEGDDEETILSKDSRVNNLSSGTLGNSQDSSTAQLNIVASIRKRVKISFVKETLSDGKIPSDKS